MRWGKSTDLFFFARQLYCIVPSSSLYERSLTVTESEENVSYSSISLFGLAMLDYDNNKR